MQKILIFFILFYQYQNVVALYTPIDYMVDKFVDFVIDVADTVIQLKDKLGDLFVGQRKGRPVKPLTALPSVPSTSPCSHRNSHCSKCNKGLNLVSTTSSTITKTSTDKINDSTKLFKSPLEAARRATIDEFITKMTGDIMTPNFLETIDSVRKNLNQEKFAINVTVTVTAMPEMPNNVSDEYVPNSVLTVNVTENLVPISGSSVDGTENFAPVSELAVNITGDFINVTENVATILGFSVNWTNNFIPLRKLAMVNITDNFVNVTENLVSILGSSVNGTNSSIHLQKSDVNITNDFVNVTENLVSISGSSVNGTNNSIHLQKSDVNITNAFVNVTEKLIPISEWSVNRNQNVSMQKFAVNITDDFFSMPKLAKRHGKSVELHFIHTKDGYLLTLHRLKPENGTTNEKSNTVLLHHGLLGSSADWILLGANKSLPYLLSKSGYDVWLSNARGNYHSRHHVTLNVSSEEFWDFSWHEIGTYDLPATIDYIRKLKNNSSISFVGHSMGASALLVLLSTLPEYNNQLDIGILLAPLAFMANIQGPLKSLSASEFEIVLQALGANGEFLPSREIPKFVSEKYCRKQDVFCNNPLFFLSGGLLQSNMTNSSFIDRVLKQVPSGGSIKTVLHYSQLVRNKKFHVFNNASLNYALVNITLPIAVISSEDDWLAPTQDVNTLLNNIANLVEHEIIRDKKVSHTEFLWGSTSDKDVYNKILELLQQPSKSNMLI